MISIEGPEPKELALSPKGPIAQVKGISTIWELEHALLERFPEKDAEEWDVMGLVVGDPSMSVKSIAVALDPTVQAIEEAHALGCNVLVTHHPAFLKAPEKISPSRFVANAPGAIVWEAVRRNVALINVHTALDVSCEASRMLPSIVGLDLIGVLDKLEGALDRGYGQLCKVRENDSPFTLEKLAARCTTVFGRLPRVWGDQDAVIRTVATATGSAGNVVGLCLKAQVDCLICGEVKYHDALDAAAAGLSIIELGHDVSELPYVNLLSGVLAELGIPSSKIMPLDQGRNWTTPEATRI
ncbi:MAG: Nif3-like dinuclear metal center hexameric protein [Eggerthellaceae bacterium]|nr:Nif3-like dinuclear metal center hexameric protein [Eggerthellaceae bacterium]